MSMGQFVSELLQREQCTHEMREIRKISLGSRFHAVTPMDTHEIVVLLRGNVILIIDLLEETLSVHQIDGRKILIPLDCNRSIGYCERNNTPNVVFFAVNAEAKTVRAAFYQPRRLCHDEDIDLAPVTPRDFVSSPHSVGGNRGSLLCLALSGEPARFAVLDVRTRATRIFTLSPECGTGCVSRIFMNVCGDVAVCLEGRPDDTLVFVRREEGDYSDLPDGIISGRVVASTQTDSFVVADSRGRSGTSIREVVEVDRNNGIRSVMRVPPTRCTSVIYGTLGLVGLAHSDTIKVYLAGRPMKQ